MDFAKLPRRRLIQGAAATAAAAGFGGLAASPAHAAQYPPTHWIPATPSNYTVANRPTTYPVDFVVVHVTQEYFQDAVDIFQNPERAVSSHYLIASADGYIAQLVREKDVAWHAGNWNYNTRSIGIEHEGWVDQPAWFTDVMYRRSAQLTAAICDRYALPRTRDHIIGHNEVPGATHTDPGANWNWTKYMRLVRNA